MADTIQLRRDTRLNWISANPVLADGEVGLETDTKRQKFGDGVTAWNSLPYAGGETYIAGHDFVNHLATFSDGIHIQVYQLIPYDATIYDYYIGWMSGTKSDFALKTAEQLVASASPYMIANNPNYKHSCTDVIFYILFKKNNAPMSGNLSSGGLVSPITSVEFFEGGSCPHPDIFINGAAYKVYGLRNSDLANNNNIITINF